MQLVDNFFFNNLNNFKRKKTCLKKMSHLLFFNLQGSYLVIHQNEKMSVILLVIHFTTMHINPLLFYRDEFVMCH